MWVDKDVLIDTEITGGHSQYVLRHFQENWIDPCFLSFKDLVYICFFSTCGYCQWD